MVCLPEIVLKIDEADSKDKESLFIYVDSASPIEVVFNYIFKNNLFSYPISEIDLVVKLEGEVIKLGEHKNKTFQEMGIYKNCKALLVLNNKNMSLNVNDVSEDDLLLGASASPTTGEVPSSSTTTESTPALMNEDEWPSCSRSSTASRYHSNSVEQINYVGLVNQAMTCYLNSLLQTLFMTPEFRNALYKWKFDGGNDTRSIPHQLQKLFLKMQMSTKSAIETTDLTTSFGWQGSEAWHQHDIQELCRVMFDALEHRFKDTEQANLINDLYEGKMLDYVKCLECGTEKSREDTFLDIPLPVRPFGSNVAYNSVEEALRAFVQPETLDGNNQYHCEKCNKKCDAHKGLKFTKFPYLLTLHLKRFDFDYNTMHRIKLNDKVVFTEKLNLNSFITNNRIATDSLVEDRENIVKCDDCSTTDSGSALDDECCHVIDVSTTTVINTQDDNCEDSDEGIDVSSGNTHNENEMKGPYIYELFSIMIHSGSASGGHYYAYIKDFNIQQWFCFNDQSVKRITEDDIKKTYGGGPQRGYYSGAYSSSTNAYMLMYRQIDKERNCNAMTVEEFPSHINKLWADMQKKEELDRQKREKEINTIKINVFCYHPLYNSIQDTKLSLIVDATLNDAAIAAYKCFKLNSVVHVDDVRFVTYNRKLDCIDCSFDYDDYNPEELKINDIVSRMRILQEDWMLEIRQPNTEFQTYRKGGINMRVYLVNWLTDEIEEPKLIRVDVNQTVGELKNNLSKLINLPANVIEIIQISYLDEPKHLSDDNAIVEFDSTSINHKLYITNKLDDDGEHTYRQKNLHKILEKFEYLISLTVVLPDTDSGHLDELSIPSLEINQNFDKLELAVDQGANSPGMRVSPQPSVGMCAGDCFGDQSNSEDSSLSDSDRTLVGDSRDCHTLLSGNSNSPADQHMTSPTDPAEDSYNYDVMGNPGEEMNWDCDDVHQQHQQQHLSIECSKPMTNYYFKITNTECIFNPFTNETSSNISLNENTSRICNILLDKRMTLEIFKKYLEPIIKVPVEYFKVFRQYVNADEWTSLTDTLRSLKDGERLIIKLGRVLLKDEYNFKIFSLKPENTEQQTHYLFDHIVQKGKTVGQVKKEILNQIKKRHMIDIPFNKCRLRENHSKIPRQVFLDDQKFDDSIVTSAHFNIYIQELKDIEPVTHSSQRILFIRHWCPSALTLEPYQEVVLDTFSIKEFKEKISNLSHIPIDNIDIAHVRTPFPCDIHLFDIDRLEWNPNVTQLDQWPIQADHGNTFFFKDSREKLKELTPEERKEINNRENFRLGRFPRSSNPLGGIRESALRIYNLENSPSKTEDNCID